MRTRVFTPKPWEASCSGLAGSYKDLHAGFERRVLELRESALRNAAHARTPEIVANLQAGFETFLEFALESGALDAAAREQLASACWEALREAAAEQARHQAATEPTARALEAPPCAVDVRAGAPRSARRRQARSFSRVLRLAPGQQRKLVAAWRLYWLGGW